MFPDVAAEFPSSESFDCKQDYIKKIIKRIGKKEDLELEFSSSNAGSTNGSSNNYSSAGNCNKCFKQISVRELDMQQTRGEHMRNARWSHHAEIVVLVSQPQEASNNIGCYEENTKYQASFSPAHHFYPLTLQAGGCLSADLFQHIHIRKHKHISKFSIIINLIFKILWTITAGRWAQNLIQVK